MPLLEQCGACVGKFGLKQTHLHKTNTDKHGRPLTRDETNEQTNTKKTQSKLASGETPQEPRR